MKNKSVMIDFIKKKYIKFYLGNKYIYSHVDAVHACPPLSDKFTGEIVEGIVNRINCSSIIATVSRRNANLNRPRNNESREAIDECRLTIRQILKHLDILEKDGNLKRPYLHLAIHGMKNDWNKEIEVGTRFDKSCSVPQSFDFIPVHIL